MCIRDSPELSADRPSFKEQCRRLAPEACLWAESETEPLSSEESSDEKSSDEGEGEEPTPLESDSSESEPEESKSTSGSDRGQETSSFGDEIAIQSNPQRNPHRYLSGGTSFPSEEQNKDEEIPRPSQPGGPQWECELDEVPPADEGWHVVDDNWKKAPGTFPKTLWKGASYFETKSGTWTPVVHRSWRRQPSSPTHLAGAKWWTGTRTTQLFVQGDSGPGVLRGREAELSRVQRRLLLNESKKGLGSCLLYTSPSPRDS